MSAGNGSIRRRPRADDDDYPYPTFLGIGTLHGLAEADEAPEPPAIWLPEHRSGSRMGGWRRQVLTTPSRPMGFRRP